MKKTTTLILAILTFAISFSQEIERINFSGVTKQYSENDTIPNVIYPKDNQTNKPIVLLDNNNVRFEILRTLNPNQIDSITIEKGKFEIDNREYNGKIIVKTKSNYQPNIINLKELILKYTELKNCNYVFSIDGEIVNADPKDVFIDEKNIMQIKVVKLDKTENIKGLYFITLLTRTPENLKKANTIYIRGSELSMNK